MLYGIIIAKGALLCAMLAVLVAKEEDDKLRMVLIGQLPYWTSLLAVHTLTTK